ncbi:MAG: hypothetical protein EBW19_01015, partial [Betaproteobacteria bacterium]|nr:hypothetical protein [Betaproteobacteria bacterium]
VYKRQVKCKIEKELNEFSNNKSKKGIYSIQFMLHGNRKTIYAGKMEPREAKRLCEKVGELAGIRNRNARIEESETTKRLAAWAAIFAVSTALAGIWGMNFEHMPELAWTYGYPAALGVIGLVSGLLYRRFKKAGWL